MGKRRTDLLQEVYAEFYREAWDSVRYKIADKIPEAEPVLSLPMPQVPEGNLGYADSLPIVKAIKWAGMSGLENGRFAAVRFYLTAAYNKGIITWAEADAAIKSALFSMVI